MKRFAVPAPTSHDGAPAPRRQHVLSGAPGPSAAAVRQRRKRERDRAAKTTQAAVFEEPIDTHADADDGAQAEPADDVDDAYEWLPWPPSDDGENDCYNEDEDEDEVEPQPER